MSSADFVNGLLSRRGAHQGPLVDGVVDDRGKYAERDVDPPDQRVGAGNIIKTSPNQAPRKAPIWWLKKTIPKSVAM